MHAHAQQCKLRMGFRQKTHNCSFELQCARERKKRHNSTPSQFALTVVQSKSVGLPILNGYLNVHQSQVECIQSLDTHGQFSPHLYISHSWRPFWHETYKVPYIQFMEGPKIPALPLHAAVHPPILHCVGASSAYAFYWDFPWVSFLQVRTL